MTISTEDVQRIAELARLHLEPDEALAFGSELDKIVGYVALLDEVDTSQVVPTAQVAVTAAPLREDVTRQSLRQDEALGEAARTSEGGFAVPGFVED